MIGRILLAVDDSAAALSAAREAVALAAALGARLRVVHVSTDHVLTAAVAERADPAAVAARRDAAALAVLRRAAAPATAAGVAVETALLGGEVAPAVLADARSWHADLIVVGRAFRSGSGHPYVGAHTRHILEFASRPVLVVPPRAPGGN